MNKVFIGAILFLGCVPQWPGDPKAAYNIQKYDVDVWAFYSSEDMADEKRANLAALASKLVQDTWYKFDRPFAEIVDFCLNNVMFYIIEDDVFYELTGYSEKEVAASYFNFTATIGDNDYYPVYVKESNYNHSLEEFGWSLIHEYIHVALYCLGDRSHDENYFWNSDDQPNREDTVEFEALTQLRYHLEFNPDFQ